jgi:ADP-heptose:LPS heptosyltransferase
MLYSEITIMGTSLRWTAKKVLRLLGRVLRRRPRWLNQNDLPRIAYWIAGGMGDAVMALPALAFLAKNFPGSTIDVFVPRKNAALLSALMHPFSIYPLDLKNVALTTAGRPRYSFFFVNTIGTFRLRYEIAGRLLSRYAVGFRYPDEAPKDRLYDFSEPVSETSHDIDQNLKLVSDAVGIPYEDTDRSYPVPDERLVPGRSAKIVSVLVHPGSGKGYDRKQWPLENYQSLIRQLGKIGCNVTLLLGPEEVGQFGFFGGVKGITICHSKGPESLIKAVTESDLFIGNDSGPAHVASLFGVPTITLFGPTNPVRVAPRGEISIVVSNKMDCGPCHFNTVNCKDFACMKSIGLDQVWKEVIEVVHLRKR